MIKCENLLKEDLERIGAQIGEAFRGEPGCFSVLSRESAAKLFTLIAEVGYETGHLYTTGENQEGFCIYWTKEQRPGMWIQLKMGLKMASCISLKAGLAMMKSQDHWKPTEKRYKNSEDFVEVFLVAVRKEYQGQGYLRKILEEPFALAKERNTICVLDTDTKIKAEKYCHMGMHIVDHRQQSSEITMYALEYKG